MNFENGQAVATCEPDIYFDEPEPSTEPDDNEMVALLCVTFQLGQWASHDPVRTYAARRVMNHEPRSTAEFAKESGVSDSFVRRRIREARALIGSAP